MRARHADSRIDHAIDKAASGAHGAVDRAAGASHYANRRLHDASQRLRGSARRLQKREQQWVATSGDYVQRHPLLIVGCAVAAGFLLSKIFQRRSASDRQGGYSSHDVDLESDYFHDE